MTPHTGPGDVPAWTLMLFLAYYIGERFWELRVSARHLQALKARGAVEYGRSHFPWIVTLHVFFPLALVMEVVWAHTDPGRLWAFWLGLWAVTQALRLAAIRALGPYWNVRVWVVPGMKPIRHGLYRYIRHPNYAAVVGELIAAPMMFGAWRTAVGFSIVNLLLLQVRIRVENRALADAEATPNS